MSIISSLAMFFCQYLTTANFIFLSDGYNLSFFLVMKPLSINLFPDNDGYLSLYGNDATKAHIPGSISESSLKLYAHQIASGLEHLRNMNVRQQTDIYDVIVCKLWIYIIT